MLSDISVSRCAKALQQFLELRYPAILLAQLIPAALMLCTPDHDVLAKRVTTSVAVLGAKAPANRCLRRQ
jgi:hypothetical protein